MSERFFKRDRAARLVRVWTLLYQHRPHGITAQEIARRVNVNVRTAYRDIRAIEDEFGVAVSENHGRWLCEQGDFLPPLKLSLLEAVTLFLSARLMARFADKQDPHVVSAFGKLASVLPAELAAHVHATVAAMQEGHLDRRYARVFEAVASAWAESRKLRIAYSRQDPDGTTHSTRRVVWPRYLEPNPWGRGCYLIAHDELTQQKRTFKLERITEVQLTNDYFEPAADPNAPGQAHSRVDRLGRRAHARARSISRCDRGAAGARKPLASKSAGPGAAQRNARDVLRGRGGARDHAVDPDMGRNDRSPGAARAARSLDKVRMGWRGGMRRASGGGPGNRPVCGCHPEARNEPKDHGRARKVDPSLCSG